MSDILALLLGRTEHVGAAVIYYLGPQYVVVYSIVNAEVVVVELSLILKEQELSTKSSRLGSSNYGTLLKTMAFGGGYGANAAVQETLEGIGGTNVTILKTD
ncbi:hypothetical protein BKA67DRAFT_654714 [Truncatella angustata]|uniref:Uncharacterized protein n=1 Tax=Truncatella angustata TaxID=152316 RepID=A0A9P8ZZN3_9PEZI|nr:uncharacterized protein BKA67DRAFT_654714 [Truncatella angustata]KAH6656373.1 hypothetical protein BKA67DRAFT_654714 [Truncatella angustata]KAH8198532.1 hypothetical protein TruAng_007311 [Truncatella angustata]